jgi:hypothetical protein
LISRRGINSSGINSGINTHRNNSSGINSGINTRRDNSIGINSRSSAIVNARRDNNDSIITDASVARDTLITRVATDSTLPVHVVLVHPIVPLIGGPALV